MAKLMIVLLVGLGAAFYFPGSRAIILDQAGFVVNPMYEWVTEKEMQRLVVDLERADDTRRRFPEPRDFSGWIRVQYQAEDTQYDAWGNLYWLVASTRTFSVNSNGPDGVRGTLDDISKSGVRKVNR